MDRKYKDKDGFSAGERLDIDLANGANVLMLSFCERKEAPSSCVITNNATSDEFVNHLVSLHKQHPEKTKKIIDEMSRIVDNTRPVVPNIIHRTTSLIKTKSIK